ncbi:Nif3-like dinuclear metal center hexameric protein [Pedobacter metabolipauper]|uniref:GTP cyclohydrolase 1 type 2 homolog n=1 Tax=Pedobacter metabolipauper TaxID=425513 RepID=A0A4R6SVZ8_9SPHI|nr:Nif3-like dinuclear metal center hexameric protein [Pedobacter metabolipauper]TDQ09549.1 dinuclear metal center YbgI/SA1388 family protein [Pedobacter metabolipauper]
MKLSLIIKSLEEFAPLNYQEDYDNSGLLIGEVAQEINAALVALDCTEEIVDEAIAKGCNLIITHHPIVFKGLKKITGKTYIERVVLKAIRHNIALYAIHTNLDHVQHGVNGVISERLGLKNTKILSPKTGILKKLVTFCPSASASVLREALFIAGAGHISKYSDCSFNGAGIGTFKAGAGTDPFVGEIGVQHQEDEIRIETIFRTQDERKVILALLEYHPYEEVAYDIYALENGMETVGAGMIGWLNEELDGTAFLSLVKEKMNARVIRHTKILPKKIRKVAVCGGSGSFLLKQAIAAGADAFVTADFKYHEFFDADKNLIIADIGHFESEQFTSALLVGHMEKNFPGFGVFLTGQSTNPVNYFL